MKSPNKNKKPQENRNNSMIAIICISVVVGMGCMAYAAVPLYKIFCQVTGYGGTTQRVVDAPSEVSNKTIKVRFDANVNKDLDWEFQPKQRSVTVHLGEPTTIYYEATNQSGSEETGTATFNVTPASAGIYFNKIECFCFTETTLKAGEKLDMPVTFFIDPDIVDDEVMHDLGTITLSYTFFKSQKSAE